MHSHDHVTNKEDNLDNFAHEHNGVTISIFNIALNLKGDLRKEFAK